MTKKIPVDPLNKGKHKQTFKQRVVPWPGKYVERSKQLRITRCEKILHCNAAFFHDMVYKDEKVLTIFGILRKKNHR